MWYDPKKKESDYSIHEIIAVKGFCSNYIIQIKLNFIDKLHKELCIYTSVTFIRNYKPTLMFTSSTHFFIEFLHHYRKRKKEKMENFQTVYSQVIF